ncbi:MAG TPA: acetyl-CoA carboxylase biotin carboxyl carrier protein [Planctomycetota bacterium]|nr:acetyl-CoA carboxylase biotin carboxyl carrier protein [Planctomycetota bacterium]
MEFDKIRDLIETLTGLMEARRLDELEIEWEGLKVALRRTRDGGATPVVASGPVPVVAAPAAPEPESAPAPPPGDDVHIVKSPMVGILYRASSPEADVFVEVGDEVRPDTVLCIIEAMKVMNELKAEVEGVVQSIEVENGRTVEYGQPLFVIARKTS